MPVDVARHAPALGGVIVIVVEDVEAAPALTEVYRDVGLALHALHRERVEILVVLPLHRLAPPQPVSRYLICRTSHKLY